MDGTKLNNAKDPLKKSIPATQELFKQMGALSSGFPVDAVIEASANLLINCIRQTYAQGPMAQQRMDELTTRMRGILNDHYDPVTGKRRNIFPYTQVINVPFIKNADKINGN